MTAANVSSLQAQSRVAAGKSEARRLRRSGLVPAVSYGKGLPSTSIAVPPKEVAAILKSELGKNTLIELALDGKKQLAMIRDYNLHPLKRSLEHVDFVEVKLDHPVDVSVPLFATGKAVGVTKGGILRIVHRLVPVRCLPDRIPVKIEADVTALELGEHVATRDLKLPEGVVVRLLPEQTLIAVVAPEKEVEETPAPGAAAAGAAAGAAAPAAGAAAPAADAKKDDKKDDKKK
ncbi:MAG TPA: 50S ribosomal protein L25 [Polyangiaceae bacterium]|jgi:large subunit ribosomal protein L25|nr:50S ribosomal protein L25 [Polyangiaceae bacterium]